MVKSLRLFVLGGVLASASCSLVAAEAGVCSLPTDLIMQRQVANCYIYAVFGRDVYNIFGTEHGAIDQGVAKDACIELLEPGTSEFFKWDTAYQKFEASGVRARLPYKNLLYCLRASAAEVVGFIMDLANAKEGNFELPREAVDVYHSKCEEAKKSVVASYSWETLRSTIENDLLRMVDGEIPFPDDEWAREGAAIEELFSGLNLIAAPAAATPAESAPTPPAPAAPATRRARGGGGGGWGTGFLSGKGGLF